MAREYPAYPLAGVGAVVLRGTQILLIRRGSNPGKGKWSIPGGMIEPGEAPEEAALRELEEETGLLGKVRGLFGVYNYVERDSDGRVRYHFVILDYLIDPIGGELRPSTDALEARFVELAGAQSLDLTETARSLINDLIKYGGRALGHCY
ncbi:MAG: NUDIX hydrolase [Thermoproteus sp. AZ2]|uniref:NUDIX hydrolase n=1 Tax=Thermoproteus sp. AZ2 TaxID=1609232 RepID=A0ACC6UZV7_9CREN|nr:MAG: DNA mismatch repair protein MutT [Thermoproteus sp. AZ2]